MIPEPRPGFGPSLRPGLMLMTGLIGLAVLALPQLRRQKRPQPSRRSTGTSSDTASPWLRRADAPVSRAKKSPRALASGRQRATQETGTRAQAHVPSR